MTGVVFAHILKFKEIEACKNNSKKKGRQGGKDKGETVATSQASAQQQNLNPNDLRHRAVDMGSHYPQSCINKMMMDAFGSGRYYHLNPELHKKEVVGQTEMAEFPTSIFVKFTEGHVEKLEAGEISKMFEQYGDFYLFKDTHNSIFMEFFFIDPS